MALRAGHPLIRGSAGAWVRAAVTAMGPIAAVVAAQIVFFPMPFGVWVQGVVLGLLGALMAVGLGLVYRLNRVVNFAQGDLGSAPAVLAVGLIGFSGVNYFVGLATGLVAVVVLTVGVEILVVRRFARSPRLMLTVATIGLSQALIVLSLLIPNIWGETPIGTAVGPLSLAPVPRTCPPSCSPPMTWWRWWCRCPGPGRGGPLVPAHRPGHRHPGHRRPPGPGRHARDSGQPSADRRPGWWPACCPS